MILNHRNLVQRKRSGVLTRHATLQCLPILQLVQAVNYLTHTGVGLTNFYWCGMGSPIQTIYTTPLL